MNILIKHNEHILFGLELEVEFESECGYIDQSIIQTYLGIDWRVKRDGSLINGIEVVSIPFSFDYYITNKDKFIKVFNLLKKNELISFNSPRCGGHIHMTNVMYPLQIYKFIAFVNRNRQFMEQLSQRKQTKRYAKFTSSKENFIYQAKRRDSGDRYQAVRIDSYKNTVECRCFKGTISSIGVFKNIEFMHCLYMFTLNASLKRCGLQSFKKFVKDHKNTYPHLFKFLTSKKYKEQSTVEQEELECGGIECA